MVQLGDGLLVALLDVLDEGCRSRAPLELAAQPLDLALARRHLLQRLRQLAAPSSVVVETRLEADLSSTPPAPRRAAAGDAAGPADADDALGAAGGIVAASTGECASMLLRPCHLVPDGSDAVLLEGLVEALASPPSSSSRSARCACCDETKRRSPQLFSSSDFSSSTAFSRAAPSSDCVMSSRCSRLFSRSSRPFSFRSGCTCVCAITSSCPALRVRPLLAQLRSDRSRPASSGSRAARLEAERLVVLQVCSFARSSANRSAERRRRADALARDCRSSILASQNSRQATATPGHQTHVALGGPEQERLSSSAEDAAKAGVRGEPSCRALTSSSSVRCTPFTHRKCSAVARGGAAAQPPELHCSAPSCTPRGRAGVGTRGAARARTRRHPGRGRRPPKLRRPQIITRPPAAHPPPPPHLSPRLRPLRR